MVIKKKTRLDSEKLVKFLIRLIRLFLLVNNKIELLKAMVNKPIKVEIKDNLSLVSKYYSYAVYAHSCVVTKDYISEYIKASDRDSRFKSIKYDDINGIRITA